MTRVALLLPSLLLVSCTVGELPTPGGGGGDAGNANGCVDTLAANLLQDMHMHTAGGSDNHDQDCASGGCHKVGATGTDAPAFRFGGTLYQKDGTTPAAGGVVTFTMTGMPAVPFYADKGGNFYVPADDTTLPNPFNGNVAGTACPDIRKMTGIVTTTNCADAGCHATGGTGGKMTVGL